jgi:uncharacterized membrane protein
VRGRIFSAIGALILLLALSTISRAASTVCNETTSAIHVAMADKVADSFTTSGWWTVPENSCQEIDFVLGSTTVYFTADTDSYMQNGESVHGHWGGGVQLYVSPDKNSRFSYPNADKQRNGAIVEGFQPDDGPASPAKITAFTVHIQMSHTSVQFVSSK